jgi:hypothetical protein
MCALETADWFLWVPSWDFRVNVFVGVAVADLLHHLPTGPVSTGDLLHAFN